VILWREGRLTRLVREWPGAVEYEADVLDPTAGAWTACRALAYPRLVGRPRVGDLVLLNTTALELGLGTGGYAMVTAVPGRLPVLDRSGPGHLVKGRYTPQQAVVLGVDEQGSPHHQRLRDADNLFGMPVVLADLHSALPAVLAGVRAARPDVRIAYVMTDGGALPAWFSMTVAGLREAGWLEACISVGQAFGGDLEAVTLHTGLLAAHLVCDAELAVVIQGPGNLGTGTRWGFSGVAVGEAVNAVATLGGRPVAGLRVSGADPRPRHRGLSHHSLTAYGRVALASADIAIPRLPTRLAELDAEIRIQAEVLGVPQGRHHLVDVATDGLLEALRACPVRLSTMGRGLDDDPAAFLASAAAGRHAAELLARPAGADPA
jgi:hypothetical protein